MYRLYPKAKDDEKFNNAIKIFNSNENNIKDAVKREIIKSDIEIKGNIAKAIKDKFPNSSSFVTFIKRLSKKLKREKTLSIKKQKELEQNKSHQLMVKANNEYKQIVAGKLNASPTDYWMIPCRTFEELRSATGKYTGKLPKLGKGRITKEYGIITPQPGSSYGTNKTPEEFLEFMKTEDDFFMAPTWCVAANKSYFDDYKLQTSKDENPRCYVFISKKYPNVRFCVTLKKGNEKIADIKGENIQISTKEIVLDEVRDSWQIGGLSKINVGLQMMRYAFGSQKINEVIKDICGTIKTEIIPFSELKDGESLFFESDNISSISTSFDSLVNGNQMFKDSSLEEVNCKFPALERAEGMFYGCEKLYHFIGNLSKLSIGRSMFGRCSKLVNFVCGNLSELENGSFMFYGCQLLKKFEYNLPKLKVSEQMFGSCASLELFDVDLSSLEKSHYMFSHSAIKTFKSNVPELKSAEYMFYQCRNLEKFDIQVPKLENGKGMFGGSKNLKLFNSELPNLIYGESMFNSCDLIEFEVDMPKLIDGVSMFERNKNLKIFNRELPNLKNGDGMFSFCEKLTSFRSDLSSLEEGYNMFKGCKNLRRFEGNLSSLKSGYGMFGGCKLDTESIKNIANTIPNGRGRATTITIGVDEMDEEKEKYIKMIEDKGWQVKVQ